MLYFITNFTLVKIIYTIAICLLAFSASFATATSNDFEGSVRAEVLLAQPPQLNIKTEGNKVLLSWDEFSNKSIAGITVYRSSDNIHFSPIHTSSQTEIDFVDYLLGSELDKEQLFYKVQFRFKNGSIVQSAIGRVALAENKALKPTIITGSGQIGINFYSTKRENTSVQVFNLTSRLVQQQNYTANQGDNQLYLDVSNLRSGLYYLRLEQNEKVTTTKFFVR